MTVTAAPSDSTSATTSATTSASRAQRGRRIGRRALGVVGAVVAALAAWGVGAVVGADYWLSDSMGTVRIDMVITSVATAVVALLGWGLLAVLEKIARHGRAIWTGVAVAITGASLVPIFLEEATTPTRVALVVVHLAVGAALIPAFLRAAR